MTHPKPSVDLGYPTPAHGRIPAFQNIEEEAAFWDTHSFTDFDEELTPVEVRISKNLSAPLSVRLDPRDRAEIVRQAQAKGVGPSTLIRMWVKEHLRQEAEGTSSTR
ncbi:MAG: BrnA antitoxin family protein [Chloroflexota bacterium]|nr:BrnA antitoxin family protein [Chloroflexota bacterium]